jgi:regulator of protease activity HflC (stomatin/prohibitin superfamily)
MNKTPVIGISLLIAVAIAALTIFCFVGHNDVQNFQVIQSPSGKTVVRTAGGYYFKFFDTVWTYPKVRTVFFSNDVKESEDKDGIEVIFSNKGRGDISSQVIYRLYTDNERILKMHEYARGDINIIDNLVLSKLKDICMEHASNITSSQAVEDRELLAKNIRGGSSDTKNATSSNGILKNNELSNTGIDVEQFSITRINFDSQTTDLFKKQQEADLQKKTAEAEKLNLQMQKEKTVAEYEKQIAESRGKAEVEKIKAVTDAQRQKELAEIKGQQEVQVATLEKQKATIEATKALEIADIQKQEEEKKLMIIEIQSKQKIAAANARAKELELSKALSETEKANLEFKLAKERVKWEAIGRGMSTMKLPSTMIIGTGDKGSAGNPVEQLMQILLVEKAQAIAPTTNK